MHRIAHISDLHFGRVDANAAEGLVADLAEFNPTLLVASGDFTQRARRRQYRQAAAFLSRLPGPQLLVPGNHDIPLYDLVRRLFWPLHRYRKHLCADLRPVFRADGLLVIGVNSARRFSLTPTGFWKDGRISDEQLLDVQTRVSDAPSNVFKVLVTHHPFIPPPRERPHGIIHNAARALKTMETCGIDLLLAGHLHMGYSGDVRAHHEAARRSVLSVQAGTAISTRRRQEPNAYNRILIDGIHRVVVDVRAWNEKRFFSCQQVEFHRRNEIWERQR